MGLGGDAIDQLAVKATRWFASEKRGTTLHLRIGHFEPPSALALAEYDRPVAHVEPLDGVSVDFAAHTGPSGASIRQLEGKKKVWAATGNIPHERRRLGFTGGDASVAERE